jgi:hypothetical protein
MGFLEAAVRALASGDFDALSKETCVRITNAFLLAAAETLVDAVAPAEAPGEVSKEAWTLLERSGFGLEIAAARAGVILHFPREDAEATLEAIVEHVIWRRCRREGALAHEAAGRCRFAPVFAEAKRQTRRPRVIDAVMLGSTCTCGCGRIEMAAYEVGLNLDYNDRLPGELLRAVRQARRAGLRPVFTAARAYWRRHPDPVLRAALVRYLVSLARQP